MTKISKEQIALLVELQVKETAAAKIQSALDALPVKIAEISAVLKTFEAAVEAQKEQLAELKKLYRSYDTDIRSNQERVKKREEQLRACTTNKEYQAILKEIDEIKKASSRIDDDTIACLEKIDAAENGIKEKEAEYASKAEDINRQTAELEAEANVKRQSLDEILSVRQSLIEKIVPALFKDYEFTKSQARGLAIVEVKECICSGCHMNIPPQMYNELHRGDELRICPHCHRMLYVIQ
jgi:predicted  nucleic acid-binding Zn-ribbon protein